MTKLMNYRKNIITLNKKWQFCKFYSLLQIAILFFGCAPSNVYYKGSQPVEYRKLPATEQPQPSYNYYDQQPYAPQMQRNPAQQPYQGRPYGYPSSPPTSRFYNNPYAFPAQYPYYDSDHYYVPPSYYDSPKGISGPLDSI